VAIAAAAPFVAELPAVAGLALPELDILLVLGFAMHAHLAHVKTAASSYH